MLVNSRHCLYANTHSGFTYQGLLCKYQRKLVLAPCLMSHSVTTVTIRLFTFLATHCNSASAIPSRCQTRRDMEWLHHALGSLRVCTRGYLIGYQRSSESIGSPLDRCWLSKLLVQFQSGCRPILQGIPCVWNTIHSSRSYPRTWYQSFSLIQ